MAPQRRRTASCEERSCRRFLPISVEPVIRVSPLVERWLYAAALLLPWRGLRANLFILPLGRNETPGERLGRSGAGMQFKCPLHRPVHRLENLDQGLLTGPLIPAEQADLVRARLAKPPEKAVLLLLRP